MDQKTHLIHYSNLVPKVSYSNITSKETGVGRTGYTPPITCISKTQHT